MLPAAVAAGHPATVAAGIEILEDGGTAADAAVAACLGVAALLYLELPLRSGPFPAPLVYGRPDTLEGLRYVVLAEQFRILLTVI